MISSLLLLSASVLATPVIISEVKATREAGHLRVEVVGDGGIDPDGARTRIDNGVLLIYLGGTRVRADNRAWELDEGAGEIRAHRHKTETELVVPLVGNGCSGPVELTGSDTGITALVGCDGTMPAGRTKRSAPVATIKVKQATPAEKLKALVELPSDAPEAAAVPAARPAVVVAEAPKPRVESAAVVAEAPRPRVESAAVVAEAPKPRVAAAVPVEAPAALALPAPLPTSLRTSLPTSVLPGTTAIASESSGASGGLRAVTLPALLLGVLALGAYLIARRRRGSMPRHIQIMETANLGPKRSLIVVRVGTKTMILGSSEAGITLLKGGTAAFPTLEAVFGSTATDDPAATVLAAPDSAAAASAAADSAAAAFEISQPIEEALADIPEPDSPRVTTRGGFRAIEGGLAGLFKRRGGEPAQDDDKSETMDSFDDLLEDSVEDQELRRKLAAGMSARVR